MNKVYPSAAKALEGIVHDGQLLAVGGFGLCGIPEALIAALRDSRAKGLTVISNNAGVDGFGLGQLLETRQIKKMISSYVGENKEFERQFPRRRARARIHAAGHAGREAARRRRRHPGLLHAHRRRHAGGRGQGTARVRRPGGYVMERSLVPDVSLAKAWKADKAGNLIFRRTARNFNPAAIVAASAWWRWRSRLPRPAPSPLDAVHLPGIYVAAGAQRQARARIEKPPQRPRMTRVLRSARPRGGLPLIERAPCPEI